IPGNSIKKWGYIGSRINAFPFFPKRNKNGLRDIFGKRFVKKRVQDKGINLIVIMMEDVFEGLFISFPQEAQNPGVYMDCFIFQNTLLNPCKVKRFL
ncbi:MAG: hypothetical protein PHZ13_08645, partial [bacterium]|nr:hypothetical protein [bacterium]